MLKILKVPPRDRTIDDIVLLKNATKEFPFFWKFYENNEYQSMDTHDQCCRFIHLEEYSKGSVVVRQGIFVSFI